MADYVCMIQEGQTPESRKDALADGLRSIGVEHFGDVPEKIEIRWVPLAKGYAFTAGKPSTSSIVIRSVPVGFSNDKREAFLRAVCDLWGDVTGCSIDEIVVTAWDGPLPIGG